MHAFSMLNHVCTLYAGRELFDIVLKGRPGRLRCPLAKCDFKGKSLTAERPQGAKIAHTQSVFPAVTNGPMFYTNAHVSH